MTIEELRELNCIIYECISGSKAYGLDTPTSDTDIKGVFVLPKEMLLGMEYIPQVSNESNDIVFYELGRFIELLSVNNPNILELLATPKECIINKHPLMDEIVPDLFLSKLCKNTFGRFALSQVKKATGLNKKIMNPMSKERRSLLDFCYVTSPTGSMVLTKFLEKHGIDQQDCGLVNIAHMKDVYGLYHGKNKGYKGIMSKSNANDVSLSSIEKGTERLNILYFNKDGYSFYCKEYKEYWEWVEKRNDTRYESTLAHGKSYDAKNMMHTIRLLEMANEIATLGKVIVKRPNREELLNIKAGNLEYDEILKSAENLTESMELAFDSSSLPDKPDQEAVRSLLVKLRATYYNIELS